MTPLFNDSGFPQLFGTPLGADFPRALVDALQTAYADKPPETWHAYILFSTPAAWRAA